MAAPAKFKVKGLCAAPFTPFRPGGEVDLDGIPAMVEELVKQGVKYAFVNGTTGEGSTMSVAEREATLEKWISVSGDRVCVIAHVGAESIADTVALSRHAEKAGAAALGVYVPTFMRPAGVEQAVELLAQVSAAAPTLPLYYYHIAIKTGFNIRCDALLKAIHAAPARVPTFRGIKFSSQDLYVLANCVRFAGGAYDILYGCDEQFLGALAMGCEGAVGSTYNYLGRAGNAIIAAWEARDHATALAEQAKIQAAVDLLSTPDRFGGVAVNVGKAILSLRTGRDAGPPRYPGSAMPAEGVERLRADLDALGFFGW